MGVLDTAVDSSDTGGIGVGEGNPSVLSRLDLRLSRFDSTSLVSSWSRACLARRIFSRGLSIEEPAWDENRAVMVMTVDGPVFSNRGTDDLLELADARTLSIRK